MIETGDITSGYAPIFLNTRCGMFCKSDSKSGTSGSMAWMRVRRTTKMTTEMGSVDKFCW